MARDIEEFLRKAAERRQQQKAQQGRPPQQRQQPQREKPQRQQPLRDRQQRRPLEPEIVEADLIEPEVVERRRSRSSSQEKRRSQPRTRPATKQDMRNQSVAEHVASHMDSGRKKSSQLGKRIADIHEQTEREVHRHLDHDIGTIDDSPTITDDPRVGVAAAEVSPMARDLVEMLSQPKTIRQAILVSEILNRPNWDDDSADDSAD